MQPPKWLRPADNLDGDERVRQALALRALRLIGAFMLVVVIVWGSVVGILGSGLFLPRTAAGVLKSAKTPANYAWTSEAVRLVRFPGETTETQQDSLRSAVVDTNRNQFQTVTGGVLADKTIFSSDGKFTVRVGSTSQAWTQVTNACAGKPSIPATSVSYPGPQDLLTLSPRLLTTKGSILNQQAWVIGFQPDAKFISQLLWLNFFAAATPESEQRWVLSAKERQALSDGKFTVEYARAWINRNKPRYLYQYDVRFRFTIPGGSRMRILAKLTPQTSALNLTFGKPNCTSGQPDPTSSTAPTDTRSAITAPQTSSTTPASTTPAPARTTPTPASTTAGAPAPVE
jgi:hypothetical protein